MPAPRWRVSRTSGGATACAEVLRGLAVLLALVGWGMTGGCAQAQVAANLSLASNQLFRGETISDDDLGATLAISADLPGGLFAGADASIAAGGHEPRFIASNQYLGIARKLGAVSIEGGVIHRDYRAIYDDAYRPHYAELYVGLSTRRLRLRAYVSPDYLVDGRTTYYLDLNAGLGTVAGWHIEGHGGMWLIPHDLADPQTGLISYEDWSLRASRAVGPFTVGLGVAASNYPVFGPSGKMRAVVQVSRAF